MSTLQTVQQLLMDKLGLAPEEVHAGARLDALGIDSLAMIEFMFDLEDAFQLPPSERPESIETVGEIAAHIDLLIAQRHREGPSAR